MAWGTQLLGAHPTTWGPLISAWGALMDILMKINPGAPYVLTWDLEDQLGPSIGDPYLDPKLAGPPSASGLGTHDHINRHGTLCGKKIFGVQSGLARLRIKRNSGQRTLSFWLRVYVYCS